MSLDAQKQLAKGYEARNMQYGGRRKVVQLEALELQEPPEKRMNWKSEPLNRCGMRHIRSSGDGLGDLSACSPPL